MVNTVYRKIKELSAMGLNPRGPVAIATLVHYLNISPTNMRIMLTQLVDQRLLIYDGPEKQKVKLTLLGVAISR